MGRNFISPPLILLKLYQLKIVPLLFGHPVQFLIQTKLDTHNCFFRKSTTRTLCRDLQASNCIHFIDFVFTRTSLQNGDPYMSYNLKGIDYLNVPVSCLMILRIYSQTIVFNASKKIIYFQQTIKRVIDFVGLFLMKIK